MKLNLPRWFYIILVILGVALILIPVILTLPSFSGISFDDGDGVIGAVVGGTTAPVLGFFGVALTFLAFWVQYQANQQLRKDVTHDRFETRFYEMLRLHRDNVYEMELEGAKGRQVFRVMYEELRFIYDAINELYDYWHQERNRPTVMPTKERVMKMAYHIFFRGIDNFPIDKDEMVFGVAVRHINNKLEIYEKPDDGLNQLWKHDLVNGEEIIWSKEYRPFKSHSSILGHYFRHLYQLVRFILEQKFDDNTNIDKKIKKSYLKTVRAQLSDDEQALIYFNSFWGPGKLWWGDKSLPFVNKEGQPPSYFLDWGIIKNLPGYLVFDEELKPSKIFQEKMLKRGVPANELKRRIENVLDYR